MNNRALEVKRADLLLRSEYAHISTVIYKINDFRFEIYIDCNASDLVVMEEHFSNSIRPLTLNVGLVNIKPEEGSILPALTDSQIGDSLGGIVHTKGDLATAISGTFRDAPLLIHTELKEGAMQLFFERAVPSDISKQVEAYVSSIFSGMKCEIQDSQAINPNPKLKSQNGNSWGNGLSIPPLLTRPNVPDFIREDEYSWFENLPRIFGGRISPMEFNVTSQAGKACYIPAFSDTIDLRQVILAYDTVYLQPPFFPWDEFWGNQSITREDLLYFISKGRVRLVCVQPEERTDIGYLSEAHNAHPLGVISRRRLAGFLIADIVETDKEYLLSKPEYRGSAVALAEALAGATGGHVKDIASFLFYPKIARRKCLAPLHHQGAMGLMSFSQGHVFGEELERVKGQDAKLEAMMFGMDVHIAHALKATLIPASGVPSLIPSWIRPMQFMGERLNFYRGLNSKILPVWAEHHRRPIEKKQLILPPVPLVDFRADVSAADVIELSETSFDRYGARSIIGRLSDISEDNRHAEIQRLNSDFKQYESRKKTIEGLTLGFDVVATAGMYMNGISLPIGFSLLSLIKALSAKTPLLTPLCEELNYALSETPLKDAELDFMSKINRVAEIK